MKSLGRAILVFAFMAVLTLHAGTGFLASFTEKTPRAVQGIDAIIQLGLVSWLGHANTLALLAFLTLLLPVLGYRRDARDSEPTQPQSASISPARMQRAVDRKPTSDFRPEDRKLILNLLEGAANQVAQEREMVKANERPRPFVRLVPRVPILPGVPPRSWFGGKPSLPEGVAWPTCGGKPTSFLAQIDCSGLPSDLWDGAGTRSGWLSFFLGYEDGYLAAKVLHTRSIGTPSALPAHVEFDWISLRETPGKDWTSLARKDAPQWPVDIVEVSSKEEDPIVHRKGSRDNDDNPRFVRYHTGLDLNDPAWKPFDWATTLLMLDLAAAHARDSARLRQEINDSAVKALEQISADPERFRDAGEARARNEAQAAWTSRAVIAWKAYLPAIEDLRAAAAVEAVSAPFSTARLDGLIAALSAMTLPSRDGAEPMQAFPTVSLPRVPGCWLTNWATLAHDHARHVYAADPRALPAAWRAMLEEQASFDAQREMGAMRDIPDGYVHDFSLGSEVALLQLKTSHLMNWIWGDTYDLVLTLPKTDLARGDFGRVKVQITN